MKSVDVHNARLLLRHSWRPFFSRFGRLTEPQRRTIPVILGNKNVFLVAPTASGKTEAILAPVVERLVQERWPGLSIVYVVPTRALANDLYARIHDPLADLHLKTAIKHGDRPEFPSATMPHCLVTTPESLDSLLCRRTQAFRSLRTVVVDEIHLLDNTYRGDQVRILLRRLREIAPQLSNVHLLSASVASPAEVAARYSDGCELIVIPSHRELVHQFAAGWRDLLSITRRARWKKLLVFCNTRQCVEEVCAGLADLWRPYPVVPHHGSLSAHARREAEEVMKQSEVAVCVATSTLEVGIDIGDIDAIVLAQIPFSVFALLQRAGRGNRRKNRTNLVVLTTNDEERLLLDRMIEVVRSGHLPPEVYVPDISVAVQQLLSYLFQCRQGASHRQITALLADLCSPDDARVIIGKLREEDLLEGNGQQVILTERGVNLADRGFVHSNIPDSQTYRVMDVANQREIGSVVAPFDDLFVLGGRAWQVIRRVGDTIEVRHTTLRTGSAAFQRHRNVGAFYYLLPRELK